jgi:hypothetical protein
MKFKNDEAQSGWDLTVANNSDPYGKPGVDFARQWAELMEQKISQGANVADIAKQCSHDADTEGITGFMYGCAVSILSQVWLHGEDLRRWHNIDAQIGTEGEEANKSGGTLNPAILNIG